MQIGFPLLPSPGKGKEKNYLCAPCVSVVRKFFVFFTARCARGTENAEGLNYLSLYR
jgi:hypothetical protein